MNWGEALAYIALVVGVPLNLYVTARLVILTRREPSIRVLRERAIVSVAVTGLVLVFSLIFFNNDALPPYLAVGLTKIITRGAIVVAAIVPALYWLWLYRK